MYVIQSVSTERFYIGSAEDVAKRLSQHNAGKVTSTSRERPWNVVYAEAFATRAEAVKKERHVKSWKNTQYMCQQLGIRQKPG